MLSELVSQIYEMLLFPHFKKARPLCNLFLNHWTKSNTIWSVRYSHEWDMQQSIIGLIPLGLREVLKGLISLNFNYKVNF